MIPHSRLMSRLPPVPGNFRLPVIGSTLCIISNTRLVIERYKAGIVG